MDPNIRLERFKPEDVPNYMKFLQSDFLKRNPMNVALHTDMETTVKVFTGLLNRGCNDFSAILYNEKDEIVGLINCIVRSRDEAGYAVHWNEETDKQPILLFSRKQDEKFDTWNRFPTEIDKVLWISLISARADYARKGLAKHLLAHSLKLAKEAGISGAAANAGAFQSQQLFKSFNFSVLVEAVHADILDNKGRQILRCHDETRSNQLVFRLI
ncbi:unnamed protein product, partial [Mesorhabditis spiculigera]